MPGQVLPTVVLASGSNFKLLNDAVLTSFASVWDGAGGFSILRNSKAMVILDGGATATTVFGQVSGLKIQLRAGDVLNAAFTSIVTFE